MTSITFTYRVDQAEELYHARLVTDMPLHQKGRFLSDYVYSIVSYGLGKYRARKGLPAMITGVRLGTLYTDAVEAGAVTLTVEDHVNYDFCYMAKDNKSTYVIDGELLPL
jgi:hypothetical protein